MQERTCSICGDIPECSMAAYQDAPFVNGVKYGVICHRCFCVLDTTEYDYYKQEYRVFRTSPYYLRDINKMAAFGWSKGELSLSINSMQRAMGRVPKIESDVGVHFLEVLFIGYDIELEGWPNHYIEPIC